MRRIPRTFTVLSLIVFPCAIQAQDHIRAPAGDTCVTFRRLWSGAIVTSASGWNWHFTYSTPSPDGRYLTARDIGTGNVAVQDLETGEFRDVTDKGPWNQSLDWGLSSVFSPDGDQLAYIWRVHAKGEEVRVMGVDGSNPRALFSRTDFPRFSLEDWSPDGRQLLIIQMGSELEGRGAWELLTVSVSDGSHRVLRSFDKTVPQLAAFSPDGRWVAYDLPSGREMDDRDVYLLSLDGDGEVPLLNGPEDDRFWGWLPDSGGILFYSDRSSTRGIWRLPVEEGRPAGSAVLVRGDLWKAWPLGFSRDAYFYGTALQEPHLEIHQFDFTAGETAGTPEPVGDPTAGITSDPAWSPDGQYLAYKLERHPNLAYEGQRPGETRNRLVIQSLTSGDTRGFDVPLQEWERIRWMPDGRAVTFRGLDAERNPGIFRLEIPSGIITPLYSARNSEDSYDVLYGYALSPDGRTLYFARWIDSETRIVARDHATGQEMVLTARGSTVLLPSPDGRWLAFKTESSTDTTRYAVAVVPTSGGEIRELAWGRAAEIYVSNWTPDGTRLIYVTAEEPDWMVSYWTVAPDGGTPERFTSSTPMGSHPDLAAPIHPDGRRIAGMRGDSRGEIWVIENPGGKVCQPGG